MGSETEMDGEKAGSDESETTGEPSGEKTLVEGEDSDP
jgi:hypothetical protein